MPRNRFSPSVGIVADIDRGWGKFEAFIAALDGAELVVGFLEGETASIALWNEFGTRTIPSRPFMRSTLDRNAQEYGRLIQREASKRMLQDNGEIGALTAVGFRVTNDLKKAITSWSDPENAPSTVDQKGENNPLIDTGTMRAAVTFEVRGGI
jgi:hypothetical protein